MKKFLKTALTLFVAASVMMLSAVSVYAASAPAGPGFTGWTEDNGSYRYYDHGRSASSRWMEIEGSWYYFDENGLMVTGWQTINDEKFYFAEAGDGSRATGICYINEKTPDGNMVDDRGVLIPVADAGHGYNTLNHPNPYGHTCVEVDLTNQMVFVYQGEQLVLASPCVTGNAYRHPTPPGNFTVFSRETNRILRGRNDNGSSYASHVNFWMPFNGGIGLHDASWRSSFGGTIYQGGGSHGCVNLPYNTAAFIYNMCYIGLPVHVHK